MYQIDMKFDRQLRPATETLWVVSYGGKTIARWWTAIILKIDISSYLSEKCDDVPHCRILSPDKTVWWLILATLCG